LGQQVDIDDLIDANGVAELLGFAHRNTVSVYQHRYPDMPRPVLNFGNGRVKVKVWLKPDLERWAARQAASGRSRPARRVSR
jgi:glutathione-regulated potassium-efflux system ancillary protein KefG